MIMFIIFVTLLVVLGLAAARRGFDSRDGMVRSEWQRRSMLVPPRTRAY